MVEYGISRKEAMIFSMSLWIIRGLIFYSLRKRTVDKNNKTTSRTRSTACLMAFSCGKP